MRRSRLQLNLQILRICRKPSRMTRIVYRLNSNWREVGEMLKVLVDGGYVELRDRFYLTTEKGWNALRYFMYACREYPEIAHEVR